MAKTAAAWAAAAPALPAHVVAASSWRLYHILPEKTGPETAVGTSAPSKPVNLDPASMLVAMSEPGAIFKTYGSRFTLILAY